MIVSCCLTTRVSERAKSAREQSMMNFRALFTGRPQSRRFRTRRSAERRVAPARLEQLEQRTLLAGNVTAQFIGQNAFINGDSADNSVEILVENGSVVARGLDGTTVNGSADDFVLSAGISLPGNLSAALGNGNDAFVMTGVQVGRNVTVNGGHGNDQIAITASSMIGRDLVIRGAAGSDTISLQDSAVARSVAVSGNSGDDLIVLSNAEVGRDVWLVGGAGNDDIVIDDSRIGRDTRIVGSGGDDDIVMRNSELVDDLNVSGNGGNDIVMMDSSTVGDKSRIRGGFGADNILLQGTTRFFDRLVTVGGPGRDNVEASAGVIFDGLRRRSFSGRTVDAAAVASRITDTTTGALAAAESAVASFGGQLILTINNASVSEGAGNGAATLTIAREGDTDSALDVTLSSSNTARLAPEQTSVTIPAGQSSVSVFLNPQDDSTVGNTSVVTITASSANFNDSTVDVTVTDDDISTLSVVISPDQVLEDSGNVSTVGAPNAFSYTVSRNGDTTADLVVSLTTSADGVIVVPSEVIIPAGQSSVTRDDGQTVADGNSEPDQTVTLTASAVGLQSGSDSILVQDNDDPRLLVEFAAPILSETGSDAATAVTVTRNTDTTDALTVTVTTQDPDSLTINGMSSRDVVIPAGEASVTVTILGVEESIDDGDIPVAVFAMAAGFTDGSDVITTLDDDVPTLTVTLPDGDTVVEDAGVGALTARVSRNTADTSSALSISLTFAGDSRLSAQTNAVIEAGATFVDVPLDTIDNNVVDQPNDGVAVLTATAAAFVGGTANVTVTNDDAATIGLTPESLTVNEADGTATLNVLRNDSSIDGETISLTYSDTGLLTGPADVVFAQGETQKSITLTIVDNASLAENGDVTIAASSPNHADVFATVTVDNDDGITTDVSANSTIQSVNTLITKAETFTVTGKTAPGATVQADNDGNGAFDEASVTADANGDYSIEIPLVHDSGNRGANTVQLRAVQADGANRVSAVINVHRSVGTVVRFETNQDLNSDGDLDFYDIEMLDADAPVTVANFLSYTTTTATGTERFDDLLVQRSDDDFVIQAGRFNVSGQSITELDRDVDDNGLPDTIQNEFNPANSNVRGTLSMALPANQPNGGSSEWFINTGNNAVLDDASRLHTVFGRVIGDGMSVVDAINQVPIYDLNTPFNSGALGETPLLNSPLTPLTGTISLGLDSAVVTGTGTQFTTELQVGSLVEIGNTYVEVLSITSDTQMTIDIQANSDVSGLSASRFDNPQNSDYIIFSNIGEILDSI